MTINTLDKKESKVFFRKSLSEQAKAALLQGIAALESFGGYVPLISPEPITRGIMTRIQRRATYMRYSTSNAKSMRCRLVSELQRRQRISMQSN